MVDLRHLVAHGLDQTWVGMPESAGGNAGYKVEVDLALNVSEGASRPGNEGDGIPPLCLLDACVE